MQRHYREYVRPCISKNCYLFDVYPDVSHHPSPLDCASVWHVAWQQAVSVQLDVLVLFDCLARGFARLMFCHWFETSGKQDQTGVRRTFFPPKIQSMCLTHIGNCD